MSKEILERLREYAERRDKRLLREPKKMPSNARASDKGPFVKAEPENSLFNVTPEERDYYYNLDFLCGTYHALKNRGLKQPEPYHGLGFGED